MALSSLMDFEQVIQIKFRAQKLMVLARNVTTVLETNTGLQMITELVNT